MKPFKVTDNPFCVYNGTGCDTYGKKCEEFKGTETKETKETPCSIYIATNGPCKSTTYGTILGSCTKRICTEAPNTLKTDKEC